LALTLTALAGMPASSSEPAVPDASGPLLTLDAAISSALRRNHRLGAADAVRDAARASLDEAGSGRKPRVDLTESFSWTTNPALVFSNLLQQENFTQDDFDVDGLNDPDALTNWNTALSVRYPLYAGGKIDGGIEAARAGLEAAEAGRERTRQEVIRDVLDVFSAAVLAQSRLRVAVESLDTTRANLRMITDLYEGGLVVESDVLQAGVRESEVEEMVIRAEAAVEVARARLNLVLGRDLDTPFRLPDDLASDDGSEPHDSLETLVSESLAGRPDLHAAESQVLAAERLTRVERAGRRPEVGLEGRYEANAEEFIGADGTNWSVFVGVDIPLFEGKKTRARVARAEARTREAERMRDLLRQSVELETHRAYHDLRAATKSLEQSRRAVELARESLRIVRDRYREGLTTLVELLDTEVALTRARTREVATTRALLLSRANLDLAVGRL
jgi:outer membrane protein TolC